jgi:hypothetical protein
MVGLSLLAADLIWAQAAHAAEPLEPTSTGEAIIGFQKGFLPQIGVDQLLGNILPVTRVSTKGSFLTVRVPDLAIVKQVIGALPGVAYVEDNALMHTLATPNDPRYASQYGPAMMGFPAAWDGAAGFGSSNVTVALVDSGILKTHEDLTGGRVLQGHDYVNNDNEPNDDCGHGTHTAGIVGATTNNGLGIAGTSQAKVLEMKALAKSTGLFSSGCSGSTAGIAQAIIDAADQGAKVISMSIGGASSSAMQNAVNYAYNKGVILVAAAGNDGGSNSIDYPGAYPNVIAVGALDSNKARASYSDGGPQLDIMAPGSGVISTYTGSNTASASLSGTSMATPHVAGAIALALSCAPSATPSQVTSALYSTADDLGAAGYDTAYGNGLARADKLVTALCGSGPHVNHNPVAAFTATNQGSLGVAVNGSSSSDPDGDTLTYAWDFGDGATATGPTATHTYASATPKTISLTVSDGLGGTNTKTQSFTPVQITDPDPATPTVTSGQVRAVSVSSTTTQQFVKILVPAGTTQIRATTTGPSCGFLSCPLDADLYTRSNVKPTDSAYNCRSATRGNAESCTTSNPYPSYWYIRVKRYSGAGTVNLTVTLTPVP